MVTVGRLRPKATALLVGREAVFAPEPRHPVLAAAMAALVQRLRHARAAVAAPVLDKDRSDVSDQTPILLAALTRSLLPVGEEAASGQLQGLGHRGDGIFAFHLFHQRVACGGISADKMPNAFFKMSRCWRR